MTKYAQHITLDSDLPIDAVRTSLLSAFRAHRNTVLVAEPGAGKTTRVPLWLLQEAALTGQKIILLEPRRVAARAAAQRLAASLGQKVGDSVGLRMRAETTLSAKTRLEVVTDGVFARMITADPELSGVGAVLFDEFHERSLDADLGLALALDVQSALREDLKLMVLSATIDAEAIAELMGHAAIIRSKGRSFPVETHYLGAASGRGRKPALAPQMASAIQTALAKEKGSILAFLPGRADIESARKLLLPLVSAQTIIAPLYAGLPAKDQAKALEPAPEGFRKIVLATTIAQTSLTIEGICVVIDSGLVRRPRFNADTGVSRLETVRVSKAAADQRRGRAGRLKPGACYRLWPEVETKALAAQDRAEILETDLTSFALALADWGVTDPKALRFLDQPAKGRFQGAQQALQQLGALTEAGTITPHGQALQQLPTTPDLATMLLVARDRSDVHGRSAALLAAMLEHDHPGREVDLRVRLTQAQEHLIGAVRQRFEQFCRSLKISAKGTFLSRDDTADLLLWARPQWLALNRGQRGDTVSFQLVAGQRVSLDATHALANEKVLLVADMMGDARCLHMLAAAPLLPDAFEAHCETHAQWHETLSFDDGKGAVVAERRRSLGTLILAKRPAEISDHASAQALFWEAVSQKANSGQGLSLLPWGARHGEMHDRLLFAHTSFGAPWPDVTEANLVRRLSVWLAPYCPGIIRLADITSDALYQALTGLAPDPAALNRLLPVDWTLPDGGKVKIHYSTTHGPTLSVKVQRLFGVTSHPTLPDGTGLTLDLLSPAGRSLQITKNLPAFWAGSWRDVRADMRGRYPKHDWPEDPANAKPNFRASTKNR